MKKLHERNTCLSCGAPLSAPVFSADCFPASAQNIPAAEELASDCGIELNLRRCKKCGLFQFDCDPVDYYRNVIRAVGLSPTMRSLRRSDFSHLIDTYAQSGGRFIECGCGNGDFLEVLAGFPVDITGTEADEKLAAEAEKKLRKYSGNVHIFHLFPESSDLSIPGAPFDCFLSFNFLEHQPDPASMLGCMYRNLREGGYGLITVPSFEYILQEGRYYELIRDHIANYDLPALISLCRRTGFKVLEQEIIGIGDTLRVIVQKPESGSLPDPDICSEPITQITEVSCTDVLTQSFLDISRNVDELILELKNSGKKLALWGAGHQGFTIASTTSLKDFAEYIIDSAPFKQGRFAPASHLPIVSPDYFFTAPVDMILIAAPGYVKEISGTIRKLYKEKTPEIRSILEL